MVSEALLGPLAFVLGTVMGHRSSLYYSNFVFAIWNIWNYEIKDKFSGTYIGPSLTAKKDTVCTVNYITNYNVQ